MPSVLVLRARDRLCAIPIRSVVEIMRPLPIVPYGKGDRAVLGAAVIRGAPTPVVALSLVLGGEAGRVGRFVCVRVRDGVAALAVEEVTGVVDLPDAAMLELPPLLRDASTHVIDVLARRDDALIAILEASRTIPAEAWTLLRSGAS